MAGLSKFGGWCYELRRDRLPEVLETRQTIFRLVADFDRRIDASNRDSGNPMRFISSLGEDLVDSSLVSAERTTALKYERSSRERADRRCGFLDCPPFVNPIHGRAQSKKAAPSKRLPPLTV